MNVFKPSIVDDGRLLVSNPIAINDISSMSPDVAVGSDGSAWVVWSQRNSDSGERILTRRFDESGGGSILEVSPQPGIELQPCITNLAHGSHRVFWIAFRDEMWLLLTRSFRDETFAAESVVASSADGLFNPRSTIDASGNCWVVCEKVVGKRTRIAVFRQAKNTWISLPIETLEGDCYRPDICLGPNQMLWISYDEYGTAMGESTSPDALDETTSAAVTGETTHDTPTTPNYRAAIQPIPGSQLVRVSEDEQSVAAAESDASRTSTIVVVADDGYQNLHTSLAADRAGNLWIAVASNRNDARRDPAWMTKWSYLYHFDGEVLSEPAGHRPDVDLYNEHAYQGWEFPAVGVDGTGAVALFGQSAHSILAQSYQGNAWSSAQTIVDRKWGSWKPRCRVAGSGPMFLVSMGLGGAQIQRVLVANPSSAADGATTPDSEAANVPTPDTPLLVPAAIHLAAKERSAAIQPGTSTIRGEQGPKVIEAADGTAYNVYFGDLHAHSVYSDAVGDVDELYHRYRDLYGYDFAALTDHDYLDGIELSESELKMIWNQADRFTSDGQFLAWYGYEWTSPAIAVHAAAGAAVGEGHRHVLYPDQSGPLIGYGNADSNTGAKLLEKLSGIRALVIPHHTSWSGTDWDAHDPELQRVVEIVSTHGRFEFPGNKPIGYRRDHIHPDKAVLAALDRGYKLGFVGGSDSHGLRWHAIELEGRAKHIAPGTRVGYKEDAYRTGMTAILSQELTRESLFEALYERRCYATSGVPLFLDFRVNGEIMGSEITVDAQPVLTAKVNGTNAIRSLEVIRGGQVLGGIQMQPGEGITAANIELEDTMLIPGEETYYYLRVLQEDGNMGWSSPIWVRFG